MNVVAEERPEQRRSMYRFVAFGVALILAISGLTARLVYLQIAHGTQFAQRSESNRTVAQAVPSTRGLIYDRNRRALVTNIPSFSVKVRPADLPFSQRDEVVAHLSALLNMNPAEINAAIDSNPGSRFDLVRVAQDVPRDVANLIAEQRQALPGVEVVVEARRDYLEGSLLSQVLGYTGPIDSDELDKLKGAGYLPDDLIGKTGVESVYEPYLRGTYGVEKVERDATGRRIQVLSVDTPAAAGDSLQLTVDVKEQRLAERAVKWAMDEAGLKKAVMIVMNPQTGEVLAMVSLPTYDDNAFAHGISSSEFKALISDKNQPLLNHAIGDQFAPGSTFKLVTGLGALADGKLTPSTIVQTKPYVALGRYRFWDWNRRGFGPLTILKGFAESSDTFFYQVAQMVGIDRLSYWAHQLGFGAPSGIDLPGEASGIIPSDKWKQDTFGQTLFPGEVLQAGIGQGYDTATPLQVLNAYCALANGGTLYRPQVVREIIGPDGSVVRPFKPIAIRKLKVPPSDFKVMRFAAREVVKIRHTYNLIDEPIVIAGKTGTAEFGVRDAQGRLPFHNWFVGFVPKNPHSEDFSKGDSQLAVIAFAYSSNTVGNVATEMVKYYLQMHYRLHVDLRRHDLLKRGNFYGGN